MARLTEFQNKQLLRSAGILVPEGELASTPEQCGEIAARLGGAAVIKAQIAGTNRARIGAVRIVHTPADAVVAARAIFAATNSAQILVEQFIASEAEYYVGIAIDDRERTPILLASPYGGSGIEDRDSSIHRMPLNLLRPDQPESFRSFARLAGLPEAISPFLEKFWRLARSLDARTAEMNPLVRTADGGFVALDCRISIDDYSVFRHPELGIDFAREAPGPPTELDCIAWAVETADYRGTFFFLQLARHHADWPLIGFHGCGGGGAMAALDALTTANFEAADFVDTSGNPPASKVYRAAKIILSQPGIAGYFLCGSGIASQNQADLARALVKAFREDNLDVPAVLRLGGNGEEQAAAIMQRHAALASAPVETYQKTHSTEFCVSRLEQLVDASHAKPHHPGTVRQSPPASSAYSFETRTGKISYDHTLCVSCESKPCVAACEPNILKLSDGLPVLAISESDAKRGRCTECIACEEECFHSGNRGAQIDFPIPGLWEYRKNHAAAD